jgi:subtilisin family serine protease
MNKKIYVPLLLLILCPAILVAADAPWWVYFRDKGGTSSLKVQEASIDPHALERRLLRGRLGVAGEFDLPVAERYKQQILALPGVRLRGESRWLNALSVQADSATVEQIAALPFVRGLRPMGKLNRASTPLLASPETFAHREVNQAFSEPIPPGEIYPTQPDPAVTDPYWRMDKSWYGPSLNQARMVNALETHSRGNHGAGVRIVVLDGGFQLNHEAFQGMDLIAQYDFINDDDYTGYDPKQDSKGQAHHGTACGSTICGYSPGNLVGLAHEAAFILAKTEDDRGETAIEEDYFVRAVEWAEKLGADVLSASLSYKDWYTTADYDGMTAPTSRACHLAYELGMVLCTAAGNEGPEGRTMGVPADAEGLLAIGAVRYDGDLARFSSRGPSADGRIKPDVLAQGVRTCCVSPDTWDRYGFWNGTSLSTPIAAGCMALILAEHPDWGPDQVTEAVRATASRADRPDPDWGWGIINVEEAIHYPSVSGWALDRDGKGKAGVEIRLVSGDVTISTRTGENGFYRFSNLEWGEVKVEALGDNHNKTSPVTVSIPGSQEVDFKVK